LKTGKKNFGPRPHWGAYSAPSDLLARFKRSYFQGDGQNEKRKRKGRKRQWRRQAEGITKAITKRLNHRCKKRTFQKKITKLKTVKNAKKSHKN